MSVNINNIPNEIIRINDCDLSEDFIAIGIELDENGIGTHSGLFVCLNEELTLFHFTGSVLVEDHKDLNEWFFIKKLDIFDGEDDFIINFKAHCELICEESNPEFGFVFDGSYYDSTGKYFTESGLKDITTCVGFCIKIIKGYLYNHSDYLDMSDWSLESLDSYKLKYSSFYEEQLNKLETEYPDRIAEIKENFMKRIFPSELTSSGFYSDLPIKKTEIDIIKPAVEMTLVTKRLI